MSMRTLLEFFGKRCFSAGFAELLGYKTASLPLHRRNLSGKDGEQNQEMQINNSNNNNNIADNII